MGTRGVGLERARRRRWLTWLLVGGIGATAIAVGLSYWGSTTQHVAPVRPLPSPAPDVNQQLSGYTFTRNDKGHPVFTLHAARTVSYEGSKSTELEDVMVEMFGAKGDRGDILKTKRCEYNTATGDFFGAGPVAIELGAHSSEVPGSGLRGKHRIYIETSKVTFHHETNLAETDAPVAFHMGPAAGTAVGMIYATRDGWLELKHQVVADLQQGHPGNPQPPLHLTASSLRYEKDGGSLMLGGPVEVIQGSRRAVAANADIHLDDRNHVTRVDLDGHAEAFDNDPLRNVQVSADGVRGDFDPATGQLRHLTGNSNVVGESKSKGSTSRLTARRFQMDLDGNPPHPVQGVATGNVKIDLTSQPVLNLAATNPANQGPEKKTLTAAEVHFDFRTDTHGLKDAVTTGPGTLEVIPADPKSGRKVITAGQLVMAFDARSRIESLRGLTPTQVLFYPPANAPKGSTTEKSQAERLDAVFDPGTQTLREVIQSGRYQYEDGERRASSDEAHYDATAQNMVLLGHPQVWDATSRVKCQKIRIDTRTNTFYGEGHVQAVHLPPPAPGSPPSATPPQPTNVLADTMVAKRDSQTIHYEGHVRAWQGTDVVQSSSLDVYRAEKRVSSGSHVVTSYLQSGAVPAKAGSAGGAGAGPSPVTVRADFLEYLDSGRRARYRGNVRLTTESTTLASDRLDVYFTQGDTAAGSQVDHAEADGHVKVTQPGRVGTSDHGEYFAGPGKIVLTGGPPMLVDADKGSTTGQSLTFYIRDDRLFVDGGDKTPSLSKHRVAR